MERDFLEESMRHLWAKKRLIVSSAFLCVIVAALISLFLPNIYRAKAIVYIFSSPATTDFEPVGVSIDINGESSGGIQKASPFKGVMVSGATIDINVVKELAKGHEILKYLKDNLGLKDITIEELDKKILKVEVLTVAIDISRKIYQPMVSLIVETKGKKLAKELADAWSDILVKSYNEFAAYGLREVYRLLSKELEDCKDNLLEKERKLNDFKKTQDPSLLEIVLRAKEEELLNYNSELAKIRMSQGNERTAKQKEAFKRQEEYGLNLLDMTKKDIQRLKSESNEQKVHLAQLQREFEIENRNYELLQQKHIQFKISNLEIPAVAKVVAKAVEPGKHIRPKRVLIVVLAGLFGLIMMGGIVILKRD